MRIQSSFGFIFVGAIELASSFTIPSTPLLERVESGRRINRPQKNNPGFIYNSCSTIELFSQSTDNDSSVASSEDEIKRKLSAAPIKNESIDINSSSKSVKVETPLAKTNTVNERLMAELQAATDAEKGPKTAIGKKFKDNFRYSDKTDEEREAALEAARDLNGVNPVITILASFFAFGMAYAFWSATQFLAALFLSHPVSADAPYAFSRMASVFRNVVMGLSSLASGFSAVSGLGVFLLGVRVAYGVMTGELDPTPIKKPGALRNDEVEIPNVWDLMMNKKPNKRGRR
eukprot:CAMPEP_0203679992 /NCGR_PEP_ID=MMETSP0090-20130426/37732_1 /ASSEMBLY_ACC=CAM_ASM_001088 /TAXON_ID=426623 /ORGANISM="Chaetoceros affinis, Strain CCMP159" /LENGTH=288 /DNA_ID=CAMNT_0050547863 /DNA_START=27 /DNA_END=893 /DNA_ORIENTATION=+